MTQKQKKTSIALDKKTLAILAEQEKRQERSRSWLIRFAVLKFWGKKEKDKETPR